MTSQLAELLTARDELLSKGRLSRQEVQRLNDIQKDLRTRYDYKYSEAPNVKMSGGELVAKKGIGGFNTPANYNPNLPADQQEEQKEGTQVQQNGYVYQYDAQGGFNTVSRPFAAQRELDLTLSTNQKINSGQRVTAGELARDGKLYDFSVDKENNRPIPIDSRVSSQAQASSFQDRLREDNLRRSSRVEELRQAGLNAAQIVTFETRGILPEGFSRVQDGKTFIFDKFGGFSTKPTFDPFQPTIKPESRIKNSLLSFAGKPRAVTSPSQVTVLDRNWQDPTQNKEFFKAAGTAGILLLPGTAGLITGTGLGLYENYQSGKALAETGEGYGRFALGVAFTGANAFFLKGALKGKLIPKLVASETVAETPFEFSLANRAGLKATPILGAQKNIVALRFANNEETLSLLSLQPKVSGTRTVAVRETYDSFIGKTQAVRMTEQSVALTDLRISGATTVRQGGESFLEIPLSGQGKVSFRQSSLAVPASQFGLGVKDKLKLSAIRGDLFTDSTVYSFVKPNQPLLMSPFRRSYDLEMRGERIVAVNKDILKRNFFSVKNADMSNSPFAFSTERASGSVFLSGRFTSVDKNVGQIGLNSAFRINAAGGRPIILRNTERFVNQIAPRKPAFEFDDPLIARDSFSLNPTSVIADTRPTLVTDDFSLSSYGWVENRADSLININSFEFKYAKSTGSKDVPSKNNVRLHEAGHLLDIGQDTYSARTNLFSRIAKDPKYKSEVTELQKLKIIEGQNYFNSNIYVSRGPDAVGMEYFAEFSQGRARFPDTFRKVAPTIDAELSQFDSPIEVTRFLGTKKTQIAGRTPSKTFTTVDSDSVSGELISKEARRIITQTERQQTIQSDMLLQFGKVRSGSTERAPLLDMNEFETFSDALSAKPNKPSKPDNKFGFRVKSIDEQMNVNPFVVKMEEAANKASGQTGNIFDGFIDTPQVNVFEKTVPGVSTKNAVEALSRSSFLPTPSTTRAPDFKMSASTGSFKGAGASIVGFKRPQNKKSVETNAVRAVLAPSLKVNPRTAPISGSISRQRINSISRMASISGAGSKSSFSFKPNISSRFDNRQTQVQRQVSRQVSRLATRQAIRSGFRNPGRGFVTPRGLARTITTTINPKLPFLRRKKKSSEDENALSRLVGKTRYSPTAYAAGFGIKGRILKGTLTGLEFRGLVR